MCASAEVRSRIISVLCATSDRYGNHLALYAFGVMFLKLVSRLRLVLGPESYMNSTIAVIFLRIGVDDSAQRCSLNWWSWCRRYWVMHDLLFLLFFFIVIIVERGDGTFQMQFVVLVFLIVYIENMNFLLLFLGDNGLWFGFRQRFI